MIEGFKYSFSRVLGRTLDIIFPPRCVGCSSSESALCKNCISQIRPAQCPPDDFIYALYAYNDPKIKHALWDYKLEGKRGLAAILAEPLYDTLLETVSDYASVHRFDTPLLVSIPGSKAHTKRRGYDQGELLCRQLVNRDARRTFEHAMVLRRDKKSLPQTDIRNRTQRQRNIQGSLHVRAHGPDLAGRNIILVDDITTTGATLREARKVLKKAGARKVLAFAIAH